MDTRDSGQRSHYLPAVHLDLCPLPSYLRQIATEPNSSRLLVRIVRRTESALTIDVLIILPANKTIDIIIVPTPLCPMKLVSECILRLKRLNVVNIDYKSTPYRL